MGLVGNICKKITGRLTAAISKQKDVSVQLEALDILGIMMACFLVALRNALLLPSN